MNTCHFYKSSQNAVASQSLVLTAATGQTLSKYGSSDPVVDCASALPRFAG